MVNRVNGAPLQGEQGVIPLSRKLANFLRRIAPFTNRQSNIRNVSLAPLNMRSSPQSAFVDQITSHTDMLSEDFAIYKRGKTLLS